MKTKTEEIFQVSAPYDNAYQGSHIRALFVCSAGLLRSPTAAVMGAQHGMNTRSCGSEAYALIPLSANLIEWANVIYFVNPYNYESAVINFSRDPYLQELIKKRAIVWDIPDNFNYMDPALIEVINKLL